MDDNIPDISPARSGFVEFFRAVGRTIDRPVTWIRGDGECITVAYLLIHKVNEFYHFRDCG